VSGLQETVRVLYPNTRDFRCYCLAGVFGSPGPISM
jgi:hypothetical protein